MADHLVVMTRYPHPGESKARFVSLLGLGGATRLQRRLTEHTIRQARAWRDERDGAEVCVSCEGTGAERPDQWLGDDLTYVPQTGGSRGARMAVCSVRAFSRGADRVVLVTDDCPDLDHVQIARAFYALEHADCVIGPDQVGGYSLLGIVAPTPALFAGIPWGTGAVLTRTMAHARRERLRVALLPEMPAVHGPGDLILAAPLLERPAPPRRAASATS
jgi:rSAM/selenodomain-associated transferase 1